MMKVFFPVRFILAALIVFLKGGSVLEVVWAASPAPLQDTVPDAKLTVNIKDYGADPTGVTNSTTALQNSIAAVSDNGVVYIPAGIFLITPGFATTKSNFRVSGEGTLKSSMDGASLISITGTNISFSGITLDGDKKAVKLLTFEDYSSEIKIDKVHFKNARVTDSNDPSNSGGSASKGTATAVGLYLRTGVKKVHVTQCDFDSISFDGIKKYLGGEGRVARGILAAPFLSGGDHLAHTEADACTDIFISKCSFINNDADKAKIDNDAVCVQNINTQDVPDCRIVMRNCYVKNWGWRAGKFQCSGVTAENNEVWSGTTLAAGVADVDGYFKTMSSAFFFVGNNVACSSNKIFGGSIEKPIAVASTAAWGRVTNATVRGNIIQLTPGVCTNSYMINLESVFKGDVSDNQINCGYNGMMFRGLCELITGTNNVIGKTVGAGITFNKEKQANKWKGLAPKNCTINGTVTESADRFQTIVAPECVNVKVYGTRSAGAGGVN